MNWWWEVAWLWLSSIIDLQEKKRRYDYFSLLASLWGPNFAFTALQDFCKEPHSFALFVKLWSCAAKKSGLMLYIKQFDSFSHFQMHCSQMWLRMQIERCSEHCFKWTHWTLFFTLNGFIERIENIFIHVKVLCISLTVQWRAALNKSCFQSEIKKASETNVQNTESPPISS